MIFKKIRYISNICLLGFILFILSSVGCDQLTLKKYNPNEFVSFWSIIVGTQTINEGQFPLNIPEKDVDDIDDEDEIDDDDVPKPSDCTNCNGKGKVGDGKVFTDCPVCDSDGDGDPIDTIGNSYTNNITIPKEKEIDDMLPLIWNRSTSKAKIIAKQSNNPILVLLSKEDPKLVWDNKNLKKHIKTNYVLLFIDIKDEETENQWFQNAIADNIVEKEGFEKSVFCLLNEDGYFIGKENIFVEVPTSASQLISLIQNY